MMQSAFQLMQDNQPRDAAQAAPQRKAQYSPSQALVEQLSRFSCSFDLCLVITIKNNGSGSGSSSNHRHDSLAHHFLYSTAGLYRPGLNSLLQNLWCDRACISGIFETTGFQF
jgi:hypothetical protein